MFRAYSTYLKHVQIELEKLKICNYYITPHMYSGQHRNALLAYIKLCTQFVKASYFTHFMRLAK